MVVFPWDQTEGIVETAKLKNHETWSHYNSFDGAYSEIADLNVALTTIDLRLNLV